MARLIKLNYETTEIECDCGNIIRGINGIKGFACNKCGKFYEPGLILCPEHTLDPTDSMNKIMI